MESFSFYISGIPHEIQKTYIRLKKHFSGLDYVCFPYKEKVTLPRGINQEIEVLGKKGEHLLYSDKDSQIYSHIHTKFFRNEGLTFGLNSKLFLTIKSSNFSKLIQLVSEVNEIEPSFEVKDSLILDSESSKNGDDWNSDVL